MTKEYPVPILGQVPISRTRVFIFWVNPEIRLSNFTYDMNEPDAETFKAVCRTIRDTAEQIVRDLNKNANDACCGMRDLKTMVEALSCLQIPSPRDRRVLFNQIEQTEIVVARADSACQEALVSISSFTPPREGPVQIEVDPETRLGIS